MKRRHHYVPRFYLRGFSSDTEKKRIHVYNLKRQAAFKDTSLKHQCYRHRFYGTDDDLENAFSELEGFAAVALSRLIQAPRAPELGSEDHKALIAFVALQHARTTAAMARIQAGLNLMANTAFNGTPPPDYVTDEDTALTLSLGHLPLAVAAMDDLRMHVVIAANGSEFLTSDHPVSRYNHYCYGVKGWGVLGMTSRGLQMFVPLTPELSLLLYDSGVYKVGQRGIAPASVATHTDVLRMNQLTYLSASENLYFANWGHREAIEGEVCSVRRDAATQPRVIEAIEEGNELSSLLHLYEEQPGIDAPLSFVSIRRAAKRVHRFERVRQYRKRLPMPEPPPPPSFGDGKRHVFRAKNTARNTK